VEEGEEEEEEKGAKRRYHIKRECNSTASSNASLYLFIQLFIQPDAIETPLLAICFAAHFFSAKSRLLRAGQGFRAP
jgi:hypothetical protein